jgi:DNA-binding transcriptional regulator PaaX
MDMKTLMQNQIREALKHKWFKGIEKGCDPGPEAINEWIDTYAETYRRDYDECFAALLAATMEKAFPKLQDVFPDFDRDKMARMARIILEEFTKIWFLEMTKSDPNNHMEEI